MSKIRMYRVKLEYIKYLWESIDKRVQYNENASDEYNEKRPYVGIVYELNGYQYFAPLEHPRSSHKTLTANPHLMKIVGGRYGIIAIGNMIPVTDELLVSFDINAEDDDYRKILIRQFIFCSDNMPSILFNARKTYENVSDKKIKFFVDNCCNFKAPESGLNRYLEV